MYVISPTFRKKRAVVLLNMFIETDSLKPKSNPDVRFESVNEWIEKITISYIPRSFQSICLFVTVYSTIHIFFFFILTTIVVESVLRLMRFDIKSVNNRLVANKIVYITMIFVLLGILSFWGFKQLN